MTSYVEDTLRQRVILDGEEWFKRFGLPRFPGIDVDITAERIEIRANEDLAEATSALFESQGLPTPRYSLVLKEVSTPADRLRAILDRAVQLTPEYADVIRATPAAMTYSLPVNAGAFPLDDSNAFITINDGLSNVSRFVKLRRDCLAALPENWERTTEEMIGQSMRSHARMARDHARRFRTNEQQILTSYGDEIQNRKLWAKIRPMPTDENRRQLFSDTFKTGLQILGYRSPTGMMLFKGREYIKGRNARPLRVGPLEGEDWFSETCVVKSIEPFVVFHEIGHVILGHTKELARWRAVCEHATESERRQWAVRRHEQEFEADRFAIDLLLQDTEPLEIIAHAVLDLFTLFCFPEVNREILAAPVHRRLFNFEVPEDMGEQLQAHHGTSTHPPSLTRFLRLWDVIMRERAKREVDKEHIDFDTLSLEKTVELYVTKPDINKCSPEMAHSDPADQAEGMRQFVAAAYLCAKATTEQELEAEHWEPR